MARDEAMIGHGTERRVDMPATVLHEGAAGCETASIRDSERTRQVSGQWVPVTGLVRMGPRDGRE
jgi:hypothetical protein